MEEDSPWRKTSRKENREFCALATGEGDAGSVEVDEVLSQVYKRDCCGQHPMNCQAKGTFDDLNWVKRCAFWYESGCKVVYRRRTSDAGLHIGEVSVCVHAGHTKYTLQRGVPKHIKGLLTPSRLKMPPRQIKHWLRDSQGLEIDSNMAKRITTYRSRMLKLSDAQGLDGLDLSSAYGALAQLAEQNQYETLAVTDDFTLHTPYVFTSPALIDADRDLCLIGNTTEHLMRNLYRQATSGLPSFAGMDSTWKRVVEKHPSIPLGTADSAQRGHWVAWAIAYSEAENILYTTRPLLVSHNHISPIGSPMICRLRESLLLGLA